VDFLGVFRARLDVSDDIARTLDDVLRRARAAWPTLELDPTRFAERLIAIAGDDPGIVERVVELDAGDLYLTLACADGIPDALAILDREYFTSLRGPLAKMGLDTAGIEETLQIMRAELLAPRESGDLRILGYSGRGHLHGWLRSVAGRTALRLIRKTPRHDELDEGAQAAAETDLELAYMKKTYGDTFQRAFRVAFDGLAADDRLLLKQRFRHRLGVEEIGAMHGVHAGTISRWVAAARERLASATRTAMMRELGIDRDELSSILRLIHSQLEISLSAIDDRKTGRGDDTKK
jgi:RNA polymerase sigma-70 factor (ECF subfamily)